MTNVEKAWLAGLFDGEGTLNLSLRTHQGKCPIGAWVLRARISNTHEPTMLRVKELTGFGSLNVATRLTVAYRLVHQWQVEAKSAVAFFRDILPYSVTKRRQILLALEGAELRRTAPRVLRGTGNGKGAPRVSPEVHARLRAISQRIHAMNGHRDYSTVPAA